MCCGVSSLTRLLSYFLSLFFGNGTDLDRIITQIVRPKVSVYMAIDGVAPRAKLNQQRSRRFRSAQEMAESQEEGGAAAGAAAVFDSNCITPGTPFLAMVSETIRYWIRQKCSSADPTWQNLTVIFSGHDIPGEGEHKIMQHIRSMKDQPHYQPNTRHCIYGQDADLIMLGLVTHEPHFTILREVVNFNFGPRSQNSLKEVKKFTKESDFQLLHLSVLREYLAMEFCADPVISYDVERCLDDFVFLTFLVGNDFLPHMPTLDIGDGAFDLLFTLYQEHRSAWAVDNPYLTHNGEICDPHRLEVFLAAIGSVETDILAQKEKDDAAYVKKKRKWDKRDGKTSTGLTDEQLAVQEESAQQDYLSMVEEMLAKIQQSDSTEKPYVDGWRPVTQAGEKDYKGRYYFEKMKMTPLDKDAHWELRRSYMEGLIWCLAYVSCYQVGESSRYLVSVPHVCPNSTTKAAFRGAGSTPITTVLC
jgi:5'-3' exoribonuclease 1